MRQTVVWFREHSGWFFVLGVAAACYWLPHLFWVASILFSVAMGPYLAWSSRKGIRKNNAEIERSWHADPNVAAGKPKELRPEVGYLSTPAKAVGTAQDSQQVTAIKHTVNTVKVDAKEHAIWAIVDEMTVINAVKQLSWTCSALEKLGHTDLSKRLWAEVQRTDFYLPDVHAQSELGKFIEARLKLAAAEQEAPKCEDLPS